MRLKWWINYIATDRLEALIDIRGRLLCLLFRRHNDSCRGRMDHHWVNGKWKVRRKVAK